MRQSGNVLFLILIAVALFAALSYAVTKSTSGGGNASAEKIKLGVSQVLQYASYMQFNMQRMQVNGTSVADIRFSYDKMIDKSGAVGDAAAQAAWDVVHSAYGTNPSAEIFNPAGGDANYVYPPTEICSDNVCSLGVSYGGYFYMHAGMMTSVEDVGTAAPEVLMAIGPVKPDVCNAINNDLNIGTGNYPSDSDADGIIELFPGERMGCGVVDDTVVFYIVMGAQ